jgi:hypothetical protein
LCVSEGHRVSVSPERNQGYWQDKREGVVAQHA